MALQRKNIRSQLKKILLGRTLAGQNVFVDPGVATDGDLPFVINIFSDGEDIASQKDEGEQSSGFAREFLRPSIFKFELIADGKNGEESSDRCDDLAEQVECLLSVDDSVNDCADDIQIINVSQTESREDGNRSYSSFSISYRVKYRDNFPRNRDGQAIDDFTGFKAEYNLNSEQPDPDDRAKDEVTYPT